MGLIALCLQCGKYLSRKDWLETKQGFINLRQVSRRFFCSDNCFDKFRKKWWE
jgi:hypothetical protein